MIIDYDQYDRFMIDHDVASDYISICVIDIDRFRLIDL